MQRRLLLPLGLLPVVATCSLSNAFLGFPDFFTNESACRDVQRAVSEGSCRCDGFCEPALVEDLERSCPSRLNERDGRCGEFFRCEQDNAEGLVCGQGVPNARDCAAEFAGLVCTDPFDEVLVTVTFSLDLEGADDCADAGVGFLFGDFLFPTTLPCTTAGPLNIQIQKSSLPRPGIRIFGKDIEGFEGEVLYFGAIGAIAFEDLDENDAVDVGILVMSPGNQP